MIPLSNEIGVRELKRLWRDVNEAFTAPITYHPGGWEDTLPAALRKDVLVQRLAMALNGGWETGTNAEATCYLSTACMAFPFDQDWTDIYCWLVGQFMPEATKSKDFIPTELRRDQVAQLEDLKRDIRSKQKSRKSKRKEGQVTTDTPESTTYEGTIVIKAMREGVSIMVGKDNVDPQITSVPASELANLLESIPELVETAEAKWAEDPRNAKYNKPKQPRKKAAAKPTTTPEATGNTTTTPPPEEGTTPELPLLESSTTEGPDVEESTPTPAPPISDELQASLQDADEAEAKRDAEESSTEATAAPVAPEPAQMVEGGASLLHQKTEEDTTMTEEPTNIADHRSAETETTEVKCHECDFSAFSQSALDGHYEALPDHRPEEASAESTTVKVLEHDREGATVLEHDREVPVNTAPNSDETKTEAPETETTEEPTTDEGSAPAAASTGQWVYFLKDTGDEKLNGLGPFYNTGDALDELGVSKDGRGKYWHRWDRLPKAHQDHIERRREE